MFAVSVRDAGDGTEKLVLEQFNTSMKMDFCADFTGVAGVFDVSAHFADGAVVHAVDGTEYLGTFTVAGGNADLSAVKLSTNAQIGYRFIPEIKTLPVDGAVPGGPLTGRPRKITMVTLDLEETLSVSVNGTELVIRTVQQNQASGVNAVSGKEEFRVLGYDKDPRVTISQSAPLPIQVNGLVTEVAF